MTCLNRCTPESSCCKPFPPSTRVFESREELVGIDDKLSDKDEEEDDDDDDDELAGALINKGVMPPLARGSL